MIVIEGVDNSGKSVLGEKLSEFFECPLVHSPGHCPEMLDWTERALQKNTVKFYDRFPLISEAVYGPILRDSDDFESKRGRELLSLFYDKKPMIIYCKPPEKIIKRRMGEQMEGVKKHLKLLMDSYDAHMAILREFKFLVMRYDYTNPPDDAIVKAVISAYLDKLKTRRI